MLFEEKNSHFTLACEFTVKPTYSTLKYSQCDSKHHSNDFKLEAVILDIVSSFWFLHVFYFLKQATRPTLHSCYDQEGVLNKTVCGVSLPVYRSKSSVSHTVLRQLHNK